MDKHSPVYTKETECQDCYKCLRNCPVKAIKVVNGRAAVMPDRCIACGTCVSVCPNQAKQVRDDLEIAKNLLTCTCAGGTGDAKRPVYAVLAPSWVSDFPAVSEGKMVAALRQLGFAGVSEAALGAQMVSAALVDEIMASDGKLFISSACPAADSFLNKYLPAVAPYVTPVVSPILACCRLMREKFGENIGIVFFSPCVAKKTESDAFPALLNVALTFTDLRRWFDEARISPERQRAGGSEHFVPERAVDGALYPVEGGMLQTMKARGITGVRCLTVSGLPEIARALDGIDPADLKEKVFLEVLACNGGCVNGPCMHAGRPGLLTQLDSRDNTSLPPELPNTGAGISVYGGLPADGVQEPAHTEDEIRSALRKVGKFRPEDELNCGGCGYDCCREFAIALIEGRAEPTMCLSYLRKQAQKQANALLRCMPSGVAIAGKDLHIIECNQSFAQIVGEEAQILWEANPGLEGANLQKMLPFADLLRENLEKGEDIHREALRAFDKILDVRVFTIDPGQVTGVMLVDNTDPGMRREQIAERARLVIRKNLETVQNIAAELGENMAETEILLRSLVTAYSAPKTGGVAMNTESKITE